jgi:hypothetical protein
MARGYRAKALRRAGSSDTTRTVAATTAKKKVKRAAAAAPKKAPSGEGLALRTRSDARVERRYEPKPSAKSNGAALALWAGAVAAGAGVYGQFFRPEDATPTAYSGFLLAGGAVLCFIALLAGTRAARPLRVGDAGVAAERDGGEIERIGWNEVTAFHATADVLTIQANGRSISVPLAEQLDAAKRVVAEARARIAARLEGVDVAALDGAADDSAGEVLTLEAPQVAGLHCKASGKLISFEKDARLCGYCGEVYHKDHVPSRCETCDAKLEA